MRKLLSIITAILLLAPFTAQANDLSVEHIKQDSLIDADVLDIEGVFKYTGNTGCNILSVHFDVHRNGEYLGNKPKVFMDVYPGDRLPFTISYYNVSEPNKYQVRLNYSWRCVD